MNDVSVNNSDDRRGKKEEKDKPECFEFFVWLLLFDWRRLGTDASDGWKSGYWEKCWDWLLGSGSRASQL